MVHLQLEKEVPCMVMHWQDTNMTTLFTTQETSDIKRLQSLLPIPFNLLKEMYIFMLGCTAFQMGQFDILNYLSYCPIRVLAC